jgi:hypothetical protein
MAKTKNRKHLEVDIGGSTQQTDSLIDIPFIMLGVIGTSV